MKLFTPIAFAFALCALLTSCSRSGNRYDVLQFGDNSTVVNSYVTDSYWLEGTCIAFKLADDSRHSAYSICGNVVVVPHRRGTDRSPQLAPYLVLFYDADGKPYRKSWSARRIWREGACIGFTAARDEAGSLACGRVLAYNVFATWNADLKSTSLVTAYGANGKPAASWYANDVTVADGVVSFWRPGDESHSRLFLTGPVSAGPLQ